MFTYIATNTTNGKFYIGSSEDFQKRKKVHSKSNLDYPFQRALRKNPTAFEWEVFEDSSNEPVLEQALLDMWYGTEQCYNLSPYATRPQCNPESASKWGKINGPVQGKARFESQTGIFDPALAENKQQWIKKGGETTAEIYGKQVRIYAPGGSYMNYSSKKSASRESGIPLTSLKRLLQNPGKTTKSGYWAEEV